MAVELQFAVERGSAVGQHLVEPVQRQLGEHDRLLALAAQEAQARILDHRLQQAPHDELGWAFANTDGQAHAGGADGVIGHGRLR